MHHLLLSCNMRNYLDNKFVSLQNFKLNHFIICLKVNILVDSVIKLKLIT